MMSREGHMEISRWCSDRNGIVIIIRSGRSDGDVSCIPPGRSQSILLLIRWLHHRLISDHPSGMSSYSIWDYLMASRFTFTFYLFPSIIILLSTEQFIWRLYGDAIILGRSWNGHRLEVFDRD